MKLKQNEVSQDHFNFNKQSSSQTQLPGPKHSPSPDSELIQQEPVIDPAVKLGFILLFGSFLRPQAFCQGEGLSVMTGISSPFNNWLLSFSSHDRLVKLETI
jgi:hypothetical protein